MPDRCDPPRADGRLPHPTKGDRAAEVAKLKAAGEKLGALLQIEESETEEMVEEFKQIRRATKK